MAKTTQVISDIRILETKDYSLFSFLEENRPVNPSHVASLMKSMREEYLFTVIIVNEDHAVIDGQHRLEACKQLSLPVYYVIRPYGLQQLHRYNTDMINWTNADFGHFYQKGNADYYYFMSVMTENNFSYTSTMIILKGDYSRKLTEHFRTGLFYIADYKESRERVKKFVQILKFFPAATKNLVFAVNRLMANPAYDHSLFLKQLKAQQASLMLARTIRHQYDHLKDVYNYRQQSNKLS